MKNWILILIVINVSCNNQSKVQEVKTSEDLSNVQLINAKEITDGYDICWGGTLNGKTPIFIHYQIIDKLVVGEIIYLNTKNKKPIPLIGEIEEDGSYRLSEFEQTGNITGIIEGRAAENNFIGIWYSPISRKEFKLTIKKLDTLVKSKNIEPKYESIFGSYHYEYGEKGYQGDIDINNLGSNKAEFKIFSVTSDPSRNIADIEQDTISLKETNFTYLVPESDSCEFIVNFYKNFAYVRYTKGYCTSQFGHNATIDGIFYKTKNQRIEIKE